MSWKNDVHDLNVGEVVEAYCSSCKLDLNHIVVAKQGGKIKKVECMTCKKWHAYRRPKKLSGKFEKKSSRRFKKEYSSALENKTQLSASTRHYHHSKYFQVGDLIRHDKFGLGFVIDKKPRNKIVVNFDQGKKLLVHDIGSKTGK